jgi:hypothetical protein
MGVGSIPAYRRGWSEWSGGRECRMQDGCVIGGGFGAACGSGCGGGEGVVAVAAVRDEVGMKSIRSITGWVKRMVQYRYRY